MFVLYRYAVKEKIGDVQILGRVLPIEDAEKAQLRAKHGKKYFRVLYKNILLASSCYNQEVKENSMVSYKQGYTQAHGIITMFISYCEEQCSSCENYCKHIALVKPIRDQCITELKVKHICTGILPYVVIMIQIQFINPPPFFYFIELKVFSLR